MGNVIICRRLHLNANQWQHLSMLYNGRGRSRRFRSLLVHSDGCESFAYLLDGAQVFFGLGLFGLLFKLVAALDLLLAAFQALLIREARQ